MKTIITSTGDTIQAKFDQRFGRAGWFCIYNRDDNSTYFIENNFKNLNGGAGTKSSEMVAELGAGQVISGDFGPKAKSLLEKFNIQMIILDETELSVEDIIKRINRN
jgi:predicted Fe-Mo cluster-binding NifX family protein